jgi:DNA-binding transcriptional LysR family regulator
MATASSNKDLSLKWLELFQTYARTSSLQATANETGLSISTVSHHLRNLEEHLGVDLFDHTRRPMVLTPTGRNFLRNIAQAMQAIRKATAEASAGNVADASYLRIGTIEDLDSDVTPELAVYLSQKLPDCNFLYHTGTSHEHHQDAAPKRAGFGDRDNTTQACERPERSALVARPLCCCGAINGGCFTARYRSWEGQITVPAILQ